MEEYMDRVNFLSWRNGILFCPAHPDYNCQLWDFETAEWTDMNDKPTSEHVYAGSVKLNGKWILFGGTTNPNDFDWGSMFSTK